MAGNIVDPYHLVFTMPLDASFQSTEQEGMPLHKKESNSDYNGLCLCIIVDKKLTLLMLLHTFRRQNWSIFFSLSNIEFT